jgi:hypothetical protein
LNPPAIPRDYALTMQEVAMLSLRSIVRLAFALAALNLMALPARAEIQKFMRDCDMKLCAFFKASITAPEDWIEDKEASSALGVQMLLPKGQEFEKAPAKIYALVRYNKDKAPVSSVSRDTYRDWKERSPKAKVAKLAEVPRASGKPAFERHQFEAPELDEQGFEQTALAADSDKDGNAYVVVLVLSANTREAYKANEAAYLSMLKAY